MLFVLFILSKTNVNSIDFIYFIINYSNFSSLKFTIDVQICDITHIFSFLLIKSTY